LKASTVVTGDIRYNLVDNTVVSVYGKVYFEGRPDCGVFLATVTAYDGNKTLGSFQVAGDGTYQLSITLGEKFQLRVQYLGQTFDPQLNNSVPLSATQSYSGMDFIDTTIRRVRVGGWVTSCGYRLGSLKWSFFSARCGEITAFDSPYTDFPVTGVIRLPAIDVSVKVEMMSSTTPQDLSLFNAGYSNRVLGQFLIDQTQNASAPYPFCNH
jgi:hypothetical protein